MLRYCAVVSSNSGAFKVLKDSRSALQLLRLEEWDERHSNILISTVRTLQQTLGTIASPYDLNEDGNGLLGVCKLLDLLPAFA
jgi:hypothetical protein